MTLYKKFKSAFANFLISPRSTLSSLTAQKALDQEVDSDGKLFSAWLGEASTSPEADKTVLIVSLLPLTYSLKIEALIARLMQARGYNVVVLTNRSCLSMVKAYHGRIGLRIDVLEDYFQVGSYFRANTHVSALFETDKNLLIRLKEFRYRNAFTGLHALATLSSSIVDGSTVLSNDNILKLKRILTRSIALSDACDHIINKLKPQLVVGVEKGFVGTAEIFYAALDNQVDYVQWVGCHEPNSIMLKRYDWESCRQHPFSISESSWQKIIHMPWDAQYAKVVMEQFTRGYEEGAWFRYKSLAVDQKQLARNDLLKALSLDPNKKTVIIYSHILNDANLFYGNDLFTGGYEEWLVETVRKASENTSVNWVLKLHPSNVYRNAKLGYQGEYGEILALKNAFGKVPEFLRIVYPEEKTSPFSFFQITDIGITVRGTIGLELPCFGIPVLTAGTGRYAGKGFTIDSSSREEYLSKIEKIHEIKALNEEQIRRGQLYAFFVFNARPARYGKILNDVYRHPLKHPMYRDVEFNNTNKELVLNHPQLQAIGGFLSSREADFLDFSF